jgi:hypothetical protein
MQVGKIDLDGRFRTRAVCDVYNFLARSCYSLSLRMSEPMMLE